MDELNLDYPIKITALGGLDEMGKNCYVIEIEQDVFVIEAGIKYPSRYTLGVDFVIPDFSYLEAVQEKIKAFWRSEKPLPDSTGGHTPEPEAPADAQRSGRPCHLRLA